jgi:hypothetical protein
MFLRKLAISILIVTFALPYTAVGQIYKWVNDDGTVGFTDDPDKIPAKYRDRIKIEKEIKEEGKNIPASGPPKKVESVSKKGAPIEREVDSKNKPSAEEKKKAEEETRAVWEKMRKALSGK